MRATASSMSRSRGRSPCSTARSSTSVSGRRPLLSVRLVQALELAVAARRVGEGPDGRAPAAVVQPEGEAAQHAPQILSQGPGVGRGKARLGADAERLGQQGLPARPVPVDRGLRGARARGHRLDAHPREALLGDQRRARLDDRGLGADDPGVCTHVVDVVLRSLARFATAAYRTARSLRNRSRAGPVTSQGVRGELAQLTQVDRPGPPLRDPVHGGPRRRDRERRPAVDPDRPRLLAGEPAVGGERLHPDLRRPAAARRPHGRSARPPPGVHGGPASSSRWPRWPAASRPATAS